jgi:hypothetical protein
LVDDISPSVRQLLCIIESTHSYQVLHKLDQGV